MKRHHKIEDYCTICNGQEGKLYFYKFNEIEKIESFICHECAKKKNDKYRKIINEVRK